MGDWKTMKDEKGNEYRVYETCLGDYIIRKGRDAPKEEPKKGLVAKLIGSIFTPFDSDYNPNTSMCGGAVTDGDDNDDDADYGG